MLYCIYDVFEKLALKEKAIHGGYIYIGPASLCPCPEVNTPFLIITGDDNKYAKILVRERAQAYLRKEFSFRISHGVIGKQESKKIWYTFNTSALNGVFARPLIRWCNPAQQLDVLQKNEIQSKKLESYIQDCDIINLEFRNLHLSIAQGDPYLTLRRSEKIIPSLSTIDLTLHPLALIWKESINQYLSSKGFIQLKDASLVWTRNRSNESSIVPLANPNESEKYLDNSIQTLLRSINFSAYQEQIKETSNLLFLKKIMSGELELLPRRHLVGMIRDRAIHRIRNLRMPSASSRKSHPKKIKPEAAQQIQPDHPRTSEQTIRGHIDGFGESLSLSGWVDANRFGPEPSSIQIVWSEQNQIIGKTKAALPRPDLHDAMGGSINCGFSTTVKLFTDYPISDWLDHAVTLNFVESKSGLPIQGSPWQITDAVKCDLIEEITTQKISSGQHKEISEYLSKSTNKRAIRSIRKRLLELSAVRCCTGYWSELPIELAIQQYHNNPILDYGRDSESATRLELILKAFTHCIDYIDTSRIHTNTSIKQNHSVLEDELLNITSLLKERSFIGLQPWEQDIWQTSIIPISEIFISTLFLQTTPSRLGNVEPLIDTLSTIAVGVYSDQSTSYYLRSIIDANHEHGFSQQFLDLAHTRGDRFGYLVASYANSVEQNVPIKDLFYYAAAIDFADKSADILRLLTRKIEELLPQHLEQYPRQSKPRHWVDRLGFLANNATQSTVSKMLKLNFSRESIVLHHERMISIKKSLAEQLWPTTLKSAGLNFQPKPRELKRWLIIGEESLKQCWLYRVEQKRLQLESIGCEVRCLNHFDLNFWECSHDIVWADAIIVCRLAATYPVLRAIAFARNSGIKVFAEIDDLIFTPEYPADYESYGGSISKEQYKNLCIDHPLRIGVLNAADEVIVSTSVLSDYCYQYLSDSKKPIHTLHNLPLELLAQTSKSLDCIDKRTEQKENLQIVITSGTLSHKQILNETIFPVLVKILESHTTIQLLIIGHIEIGAGLKEFGQRIESVPFTDYSTYLKLLKASDIALVPLEVHPTTHGKSAIKWMEASLCGVTCICSPVRAYTDVISHGETGLIAETAEQWHQAITSLINDPSKSRLMGQKARLHANNIFDSEAGKEFWRHRIADTISGRSSDRPCKKVLVMNVFFAHQSIGGATRVAQDYVQEMLIDQQINYEVTVLCTEYNNWQSDPPNLQDLKRIEQEPFLSDLQDVNYVDYRNEVQVDVSNWRGARIIRLSLPPKLWSEHHDPLVEAFCDDLFNDESFDLIQCHCCQLLTAAPLVVARRRHIPYEIVMHDAWWMSDEQFLVSADGRLINPADPLSHFDYQPSPDQSEKAFKRRADLYQLLEHAQRRIAVSEAFKRVCEGAGIKNVDVQVNSFTEMGLTHELKYSKKQVPNKNYRLCHIGGMSIHKGYQLLRQAVYHLPKALPIQFTVIDHRLASSINNYHSNWNGYHVDFIAPIPMNEMPKFYSEQDVLIAPSIWPESFGLVTREALSAGLWVIASDTGALAEPILNTKDHNGFVIQPNNLDDLITALRDLPIVLKTKADEEN